MPAAIETINGTSLAVFHRDPAWHRLGTVFTEAPTIAEAIAAAHLGGWNVRTVPLRTWAHADTDPADYGTLDVPGHRAIIRNNPLIRGQRDVLGVMGRDWHPVQNEDAFAFGQNLLDADDLRVEAAGSLKEGRRVWMLLRLPNTITVGDGDVTYPYLLIANGHDGSLALTAKFTAVRVVCANTLALALHSRTDGISLRHTSNVTGRVQEAREALRVAYKGMDAFQQEAEALINATVTDRDWDRYVNVLLPLDPDASKATVTRQINKRDTLRQVYAGATNDGIRGTAWGAYNAAVEWADFYAAEDQARLARRAVSSSGQTWKRKAHQAARSLLVPA